MVNDHYRKAYEERMNADAGSQHNPFSFKVNFSKGFNLM